MKLATIISATILIVLTGCAQCGDGICQRIEKNRGSCDADCENPEPYMALKEECQVQSLTKTGDGAFPKISPNGSLIAFTKESSESSDPAGITFQVYTMKIDGTDIKCLTCDKPALAETGWRGQPFWHPSGDYVVFTAESKEYPRKGAGVTTRPGIGRNHNVWIMTSDGENFWRMTDYEDNWGVIRPSFSHDGTRLYWNEEYQMELYPEGKPEVDNHPGCYWGTESLLLRKGEELCSWRVKIAQLSFEGTEPKIWNVKSINPPEGYTVIEGAGFLPNDDGFAYSYCNIAEQKGRCLWGNIYTSNLEGTALVKLTSDFHEHNENPEFSPDGSKILWNHGEGDPGEGEEMYLMDSDGTAKTRLTHFTEPGYPEYNESARQVPESDWGPDGTYVIFAHVNGESRRGLGVSIPAEILMIKFKGKCG